MPESNTIQAVIKRLEEKNAENIRLYEVFGKTDYTDRIIVCSGNADIHNKAIANHLIEMAKEDGIRVIGKEGMDSGQWILLDAADLVVHIFLPQLREYYQIDELFSKLEKRKLEEDTE